MCSSDLGGLGGEGEVRLHRGRSGHVHRLGGEAHPLEGPLQAQEHRPLEPPLRGDREAQGSAPPRLESHLGGL